MGATMIQDITAALAALLSIGGIVVLALEGETIPAELASFAGLSAGWLFRGPVSSTLRNGGRT